MSPDSANGTVLLNVARAAIAEQFKITLPVNTNHPWLHDKAATFVTLMLDNKLRGCIGSLHAHRALKKDVYENARGAAFRDPRFAALSQAEYEQVEIEVSLLTSPTPIEFTDETDALQQLSPGRDGIIFSYDNHRSTFLPQVWEQLSEPKAFLEQLKVKARLSADFWHPDVKLERYAVKKWRELDYEPEAKVP